MTSQIAHKIDKKWRSDDIKVSEQVDFSAFFLNKNLYDGLHKCGFLKPSPIQLIAIPLGKLGMDLVVQAKSGTGKTCVFTVVALESISTSTTALQSLIVAPTREIAIQIRDIIREIGIKYSNLYCHSFVGGISLKKDKDNLKRCHIAVGTPGRLKQLIENNYLKTESIRLMILDEADKLLTNNTKDDVNWIFKRLPLNKQIIACSATYPQDLADCLKLYMRTPMFARLDANKPALIGIIQYYQIIPSPLKNETIHQYKEKSLLNIIKNIPFSQCIIFSNFQTQAGNLFKYLKTLNWPVSLLCSTQTQDQRIKALNDLKNSQCKILVTTDLASRGIDAEHVNLVINYDIPWDVETYLHRIGRCGRYGSKGLSITLVAVDKELGSIRKIQHQTYVNIYKLPEELDSIWNNEPNIDDANLESLNQSQKHEPSQSMKDSNIPCAIENNSLPSKGFGDQENITRTLPNSKLSFLKKKERFICNKSYSQILEDLTHFRVEEHPKSLEVENAHSLKLMNLDQLELISQHLEYQNNLFKEKIVTFLNNKDLDEDSHTIEQETFHSDISNKHKELINSEPRIKYSREELVSLSADYSEVWSQMALNKKFTLFKDIQAIDTQNVKTTKNTKGTAKNTKNKKSTIQHSENNLDNNIHEQEKQIQETAAIPIPDEPVPANIKFNEGFEISSSKTYSLVNEVNDLVHLNSVESDIDQDSISDIDQNSENAIEQYSKSDSISLSSYEDESSDQEENIPNYSYAQNTPNYYNQFFPNQTPFPHYNYPKPYAPTFPLYQQARNSSQCCHCNCTNQNNHRGLYSNNSYYSGNDVNVHSFQNFNKIMNQYQSFFGSMMEWYKQNYSLLHPTQVRK